MILCGVGLYIESVLLESTFKVFVLVFAGGGGGGSGGGSGGFVGIIFTPVVQ